MELKHGAFLRQLVFPQYLTVVALSASSQISGAGAICLGTLHGAGWLAGAAVGTTGSCSCTCSAASDAGMAHGATEGSGTEYTFGSLRRMFS